MDEEPLITSASADALASWHGIPMRFEYGEVVDLDRIQLDVPSPEIPRRPVPTASKDYDVGDDVPARWAERFDLTHWAFFQAIEGDRPIGGAALAADSAEIPYLVAHPEVAILWDIRVMPDARRRGVGTALFEAVAAHARADGRTRLLIETQDNNIAACRFYSARGCHLSQVNRGVYASLPQESQLIWFFDL